MDHEPIWKRARADLLIPITGGDHDLFLWEHSWRIARTAETIAGFPEVGRRGPDVAAVIAAALYHDAGWSVRCRAGECDRTEILTNSLSEGDREESARLLERSLGNVLGPDTLQRAVRAVRSAHDRSTDCVEAMILADARSVQEFGVLSLWPMIRRGMQEGKGVQAVLDVWQRKKEYHFWDARLGDSFHFEAVRELARRRLEQFERLIVELKEQHYSEDAATAASPPPPPQTPTPARPGL